LTRIREKTGMKRKREKKKKKGESGIFRCPSQLGRGKRGKKRIEMPSSVSGTDGGEEKKERPLALRERALPKGKKKLNPSLSLPETRTEKKGKKGGKSRTFRPTNKRHPREKEGPSVIL